jgi:hypothetical protein
MRNQTREEWQRNQIRIWKGEEPEPEAKARKPLPEYLTQQTIVGQTGCKTCGQNRSK